MFTKIAFIRWIAVPALVVGGLVEFLALQRAQWLTRRTSSHV